MKALERYLNSFGKFVIQQSRSNLTRKKKNVTKELYNSLNFNVLTTPEGFSVKFYMADYGTFVDKGVSGNKQINDFTTYDGRKIESPFKYTTKGPPIDIISKWIKMRGIAPKGLGKARSKKTGQYISPFAFLISRKIKRDGIKGISFFQRPLGLGLKKLPNEIFASIKEEITNNLRTIIAR
tara:strand:- start:39 stop:581 length:543 start_codon:yes stop_codon:yes gene_type:complete